MRVGNSNILLLLIFIGAAHFLVDTMLGVMPLYKSLAGLDMATAGIMVAVGALIGEGSQLIFGSFSDKGYGKIFIVVGLLIAMGNVWLPFVSSYPALFSFHLMTCIGSGAFHPCAASLLSSLNPARRSLMMSIFATGGSLGLATSQLSFTQAYVFFDKNTAVLAIPALLLAVLIVFFRFPHVRPNLSAKQGASLKDFIHFFKNPPLRNLYISQIANQSILWGTIFILPDVLKTMGYPEWISYGGGHFCFIIGASCMLIPAGYLADLFSPRSVMLAGGIVSCIAFYVIIFLGGITHFVLLPTLFILGASLSLVGPLAVSAGIKLEPGR